MDAPCSLYGAWLILISSFADCYLTDVKSYFKHKQHHWAKGAALDLEHMRICPRALCV